MEVALAWLRYAESPSPTNSSWRHQDGGLHPNTAPSRSNTAAAASCLGLCPGESGQSLGMETPFTGPHYWPCTGLYSVGCCLRCTGGHNKLHSVSRRGLTWGGNTFSWRAGCSHTRLVGLRCCDSWPAWYARVCRCLSPTKPCVESCTLQPIPACPTHGAGLSWCRISAEVLLKIPLTTWPAACGKCSGG